MDAYQQRMLPVAEVADMDTRLGPDGRHVDLVFQRSQRHHVGFARDPVEAGSTGFVEDAVEHVGHFFGEGPCHVEFPGPPEDAQNWFVIQPILRTRSIKCAFLDGYTRFCTLHCISHPKLVTLEERSTKNVLLPTLCYFLSLQRLHTTAARWQTWHGIP